MIVYLNVAIVIVVLNLKKIFGLISIKKIGCINPECKNYFKNNVN